MPLVRIDLIEGKPPEYRADVGQVVYDELIAVFGVPKNDRFQVITEHPKTGLHFDPNYLGIHRSDACVFIQITLNSGRTVEQKQQFYRAVADGLHETVGLRRNCAVKTCSSTSSRYRRRIGRSGMAKRNT